MASELESPRSHSGDAGMDSRTNSEWELLSMSQLDVSGSQDSGTSTPKEAGDLSNDNPQGESVHQNRPQLDDSFLSALGVEGFLQADRGDRIQSPLHISQADGAQRHQSSSQVVDSGVLVQSHVAETNQDTVAETQQDTAQDDSLQKSEADMMGNEVFARSGDFAGEGSGMGVDITQGKRGEMQTGSKKESEQYADSPVSPLGAPASFGTETSYASSYGPPHLTPPPEERARLGSWMGVPPLDDPPADESDAESEPDLGSPDTEGEEAEEEKGDETVPQASLLGIESVDRALADSVAAVGGSEGGGEREPSTALQKWFPYEAWWQKQETLRRWVKKVLSQPMTVWSLGLTAAVLGVLFLHQMWRNRDLQAQLRAGNKKLADQEDTIRRLREAIVFRRRAPMRVPLFRFAATTWS